MLWRVALVAVLFGVTSEAVEPWKIKYSPEDGGHQQGDRQGPRREMISPDQGRTGSGQAEGEYRWIVMDPTHGQSFKEPVRQMVSSAEPMMRQQEQLVTPQAIRQQSSPVVGIQQPSMNLEHSSTFRDQAANPQIMRYYEDAREGMQSQMAFQKPAANPGMVAQLDAAHSQGVKIAQPEPAQAPSGRWDNTVQGRPGPSEYMLPPLYENAFSYQQPTFIQAPEQVVMARPQQQSEKALVMPMYAPPTVSQQPSVVAEVSVVSPQVAYPQSGPSDEYTRMDSASSDMANSYCADYTPENRNQVLFKDPNSPIHFLTCIGKNQLRRMVCPRYTVFNEYNKRCVQRQHANDKCGPCENGGDCVQDPTTGAFRCECTVNFKGDNCEIFDDPCKRNPCGSNGLCFNISSAPGYLCQCPDHVFNDNCNERIENNCNRLGSKRFYGERGNLFVHCSDDGLAFVKKCPAGMVFNDAKETCTFPPSYAREVMVHPPGSFRAESAMYRQDEETKTRPKRSTMWAW